MSAPAASERRGRPAVFLDRDGVINEIPRDAGRAVSPRSLEAFIVLPGVSDAVDALHNAEFAAVVISNQPDVARGNLTNELLDAMHTKLRDTVDVDAVYVCPHDGPDRCGCRKPATGMIKRAAHDLGLDLQTSWLVGDRWVDIAAAQAAGLRSILVEHEHSWSPTSSGTPAADLRPSFVVSDLPAAVAIILANSRN